MLAYLLLIVVLFLFFIHILFNHNRKARLMRKIPGPRMSFIVGNAFDIMLTRAQYFQFLRNNFKTWKTIWRLWSYPYGAVAVYKPDDVAEIISSLKHNNKFFFYDFLKPWLQNGLLVSEGETWQKRRKILTPAFHFNILRRFFLTFEDNSKQLVQSLETNEGKPVDVLDVISEFTLHTICETAMGTQLNTETTFGKSYTEAINGLGKVFAHRASRTYLYVDFIYNLTKSGRQEKKFLNIIHSFTKKVVNLRRSFIETNGNTIDNIEDSDFSSKKGKIPMLDLLMSAEAQGLIDGKGIQEEVDTFMFEGHDTTATGLTYLILCLANYKWIQDKIVDELKEIYGDSKRSATFEDLSRMNYLERCIKESLRLYPPVPLIGRVIGEEVKLAGYVIPAGICCIINVFDIHRQEDIYKDPLVFDPDRFLPEISASRHPFAYIPFSAGPRNCVGQKFAMLEMKCVISEILRKFVLLPVTKIEDIRFTVDLVLKSIDPLYVTFAKRTNAF